MNKTAWALILLMSFFSCRKNTPPVASFSIDPPDGDTHTEFSFDAGGSHDEETPVDLLSFSWDWDGDGGWDTALLAVEVIKHRFRQPGTYNVGLEVMDEEGLTGLSSRTMDVSAANEPPVARITVTPKEGAIGDLFTFDCSQSMDSETPPENLLFRWDWDNTGAWTLFSKEKAATHQYDRAGKFVVTLEVTDGGGLTDKDTVWVLVGDYDGKLGYEGRDYKFKAIGTQTWMVENLAFLPSVSPPQLGSKTSGHYYVYDYRGSETGQARATVLYRTDGVLYNWEAARTACPPGWRLPSDTDWKKLETYLGMSPGDANQTGMRLSGDVGKKLKSRSGWAQNGNGDNSSGFNLVPAGACDHEGGFYARNLIGFAWTSTVSRSDPPEAFARSLTTEVNGVARNSSPVANGYPVRCILGRVENTKPTAAFSVSQSAGFTNTMFEFDASASSDAETPASQLQVRWDFANSGNWTDYTISKTTTHEFPRQGTYVVLLEVVDEGGLTDTEMRQIVVSEWPGSECVDPDGRSYQTVAIGNQLWMAENLAYLPTLSYDPRHPTGQKRFFVSGYTGTNVADAKQRANYLTYGVLYNWYAAMNDAAGSYEVPSGVQGICPEGWHLPSDEEWRILEKFLGMSAEDGVKDGLRSTGSVGGKLKEAGTAHWESPNAGANNLSGFTAIPGGYCSSNGTSNGLGSNAYFWSTSWYGTSGVWIRALYYLHYGVNRGYGNRSNALEGYSVRCLRN